MSDLHSPDIVDEDDDDWIDKAAKQWRLKRWKKERIKELTDGEDILSGLLSKAQDEPDRSSAAQRMSQGESPSPPQPDKQPDNNVTQWSIGGNGRYVATGRTAPKLPAGVYSPFSTPYNTGLEKVSVNSDGIYRLPDMATQAILSEIETFWNNEGLYRKHNLLYKRGVILWGEPGSGKSIAIKLLMNEIMKRDGVVILIDHVQTAIGAIKDFRKVEPSRNVILVFEDIDEIIHYNGESSVLSLLDGEQNIDNVLNLASTNYPDRLGARIMNRPSRFDRRIYVGMPSAPAREAYFIQATDDNFKDVERWVKDTEGMSIAHLRELVAAVYCLNQDYDSVIERLKKMAKPVKVKSDGFKRESIGIVRTEDE